MPAEAIHLSALADSLVGADAEIARLLERHPREARFGALLVDMPYFERFPMEMLRYMMGGVPRPSPWGDRFHRQAPARVGLELLRAARIGKSRSSALCALALGYLSHVAVDGALHPLVNRLARIRAGSADLGQVAAQHREVEKFQSVLFHERRFGADLMGTRALERYIELDAGPLLGDAELFRAIDGALTRALGGAPSSAEWRAWFRGYRQYTKVLASMLGKLPAPPAAKARELGPLYDEPQFEREYTDAVARSRRYLSDAFGFHEGELQEARYFAAVPEGSIDDPPPT